MFMTISLIFSSLLIFIIQKSLKEKIFLGNKNRINNFSEQLTWNRKACLNDRREKNIPSDSDFRLCWLNRENESIINSKKEKNIFIYGNSYNEQLMPVITYISKKRLDLKFNSFASTGCISSKEITHLGEKNLYHCANVYKSYFNFFVKNSKNGDILILASSVQYFTDDFQYLILNSKKETLSFKNALNVYINELKELSEILNKDNKKLVLISAIPSLKSNPNLCAQWYSALNKKCSKELLYDNAHNEKIYAVTKELKNLEKDGILFLNIYDELIKIFKDKKENIYDFYFNESHLSKLGALELKEYFNKSL